MNINIIVDAAAIMSRVILGTVLYKKGNVLFKIFEILIDKKSEF